MKKGFTLVELLIVLAVIAALMAVATPMALNAVKQAKASQVAQNLQNIKTAVENYVSTERTLPNATDLVSKGYISTFPSNYKIDFSPNNLNSGESTVTIIYQLGDVKLSDVQNQNPSVVGTGTTTPAASPSLVTKVVKWW
ncbi:MAG TPA: prepilin-type N-terminal cleavage/methylation domain-containing protein [Fervidobacterium sp.]|nr:prepilin-type N-terminal cleavage/methylation domain-containing protein [Fervidobacterium sp.]